ncbi:actin interacting protein [Salix suchowensis]|nr:actin interacting protein [Salix suchowensis]
MALTHFDAVSLAGSSLSPRRLACVPRRWHSAEAPFEHLNPVTEQEFNNSPVSSLHPRALHFTTVVYRCFRIRPINNDWMGKYHGKSTTVLKPKTTQQVSDIVKLCWERRIGIVPQGGNTGLVGGSVQFMTRYSCRRRWMHLAILDGLYRAASPHHAFRSRGKGQLFIGAEGTLGIITGVSILTPPAPQASNNVILALPHFDNVLPLYKEVKRQLSEILSAFEFIDRTAYDLAVKHGQGRGLTEEEVDGAQCFVLVETSGGRRDHDEESPAQFSSLWSLREGVTEAVSKEGKAYKYDISVPLSTFKQVVDVTRDHLKSKGLLHDGAVKHVIGYGHVGDGNLHLNVIAEQYMDEIQDALEPFIYELVGTSTSHHLFGVIINRAYISASHRGSISAEHGIALMKQIKQLFDPRGIMNPGKVIEL